MPSDAPRRPAATTATAAACAVAVAVACACACAAVTGAFTGPVTVAAVTRPAAGP